MTAQERSVLSLSKRPASDRKVLSERLHKVLANAGLGSRRMLEKRIEEGAVTVNGDTAHTGNSVSSGDRVEMDGRQYVVATDRREDARVLACNKPEGQLTTRDDPEGRPTVFENITDPPNARWIAIGRLDINTTGLLLLTTDGELANALMHPSSEVEREYLCRVQGMPSDDTLKLLQTGIELEDGRAHFDQIIAIDSDTSHAWFRVVIREGRKREVRRMWEAAGCQVSRLKRIRYGCISLPRRLKRGENQELEAGAIEALRQLAGIEQPSTTLTLKPVSRQRRTLRRQTEITPTDKTPSAWTGAYQDERRELSAWDRTRPESTGRRGRPGTRKPRGGKEVNGNLIQPERPGGNTRRKSRRKAAPGQELPSVRTWFAGDDRPGGGNKGKPRGKQGPRKPGGRGSNRGNHKP